MKTTNIFWLFILIFILIFVSFTLLNKTASQTPDNLNLGQVLNCESDKFDKSILTLPGDAVLIKAFISFDTLPLSTEHEQKLADLQIGLDTNSAVFDYMWATIPADSLCGLAEEENVKSIFTLGK
jgi:hypothetical protein